MHKILVTTLCLMLVFSCTDVVEEDISGQKVKINSPPDNFVTTKSVIQFWWDELPAALEYQLQVVQPNFNYITELIFDSAIVENKISIHLSPGKYQWRVWAMNQSYKSSSPIHNLQIDSGMNVQDLVINLITPKKGSVLSAGILDFSWEEEEGIDDYRLEVRSPDWSGELVFPAQILSNSPYQNQSFALADGIYSWGIQGQTNVENTSFSTGTFTVDQTPPGQPILSTPLNNSSQNGGALTFAWFRSSDNGTTLQDSFFLYADPGLSILARPPFILVNPTHQDSLPPGEYYWQVRSFDLAKNVGPKSLIWHLTIQP